MITFNQFVKMVLTAHREKVLTCDKIQKICGKDIEEVADVYDFLVMCLVDEDYRNSKKIKIIYERHKYHLIKNGLWDKMLESITKDINQWKSWYLELNKDLDYENYLKDLVKKYG